MEDSGESSTATPATSAKFYLRFPESTAEAALVSDDLGRLYVAAKTPDGMIAAEAHEFADLIKHLSYVAQLAHHLRVTPSAAGQSFAPDTSDSGTR